MRRLGVLVLLPFLLTGCGSDAEDPSAVTRPTAAASEAPDDAVDSLAGLDVSDEVLIGAGLTPVRTADAACDLLFGDRDVPALAAAGAGHPGTPETGALQDVLTTVAYSGPDELRDDAGYLIDHLDIPADYLDDADVPAAQERADRLAEACALNSR